MNCSSKLNILSLKVAKIKNFFHTLLKTPEDYVKSVNLTITNNEHFRIAKYSVTSSYFKFKIVNGTFPRYYLLFEFFSDLLIFLPM